MNLIQFRMESGDRYVGLVIDAARVRVLRDLSRTYDLVMKAYTAGESLEACVRDHLSDWMIDYDRLFEESLLLPPLDHPDPAHCLVTGTGLNHLGSALARNEMHARAETESDQGDQEQPVSDSLRMFQWGREGGKPRPGTIGVQPEWFYKGDGSILVPPSSPLDVPPYALSGGEEAELVGLYVVSPRGEVLRVGYTLGNEFSDHEMERRNYLYLAHSKLRRCSIGPEMILGPIPSEVCGQVRILREQREIWSAPFESGEDHMTHSMENLEHHHFKYEAFRQPGQVHCHFIGASVLSFKDGVRLQAGDVIEISSPRFMRPLRNTVSVSTEPDRLVQVLSL